MENALSAQLFCHLAEVLPESLLHLWPEPRPLPQHHQYPRERATYERPLGNRQSTTFSFLLHPPLSLGMNHNANSAQLDRCSTPHPPDNRYAPYSKSCRSEKDKSRTADSARTGTFPRDSNPGVLYANNLPFLPPLQHRHPILQAAMPARLSTLLAKSSTRSHYA